MESEYHSVGARGWRGASPAQELLDLFAQTHKNAPVRTTVDIPDELLRQAKARAALDGMKLKDLITRYVEQGLRDTPPIKRLGRRRSDLPVARAATGRTLRSLTNADIEGILEEDAGARSD